MAKLNRLSLKFSNIRDTYSIFCLNPLAHIPRIYILRKKEFFVSTCKPLLIKDTDYMVEKNYNLAPYLDPFMAYVMPQLPT